MPLALQPTCSAGALHRSRTIKLRQLECKRLKKLVPTVADTECNNEVVIIREAIKHISTLEEAVLRRLIPIPLECHRLLDLEVPHTRRSSTNQLIMMIFNRKTDKIPQLPALPRPSVREASTAFDSAGTTPTWTDEDEYPG
ncbi:unnamed protein product [Dicrocoelium dendriticum]|nr:unnamed protein product [Dicrocoelium dendriticum]